MSIASSSNPVDHYISRLRSNHSSLTALSLPFKYIGDEGAFRLSVALARNSTLTSLHLPSNHLSAEGAGHLATVLLTNSTLTSLDLSDNQIKDEGALRIASALAFNATLSSLVLPDISPHIALHVAELLDSNARGWSPLLELCVRGMHRELEPQLAALAPPDLNRADCHGKVPLLVAASRGHAPLASLLLSAGADPNVSRAEDGKSPLWLAAQHGNLPLVALLLSAGADKDSFCMEGTALSVSLQRRHFRVFEALLAAGADPDFRTHEFSTLLWSAAQRGDYQTAQRLLSAGADPDLQQPGGPTLLWWAALHGKSQLVELLLGAGVDPNQRDAQWQPVLALAFAQGSFRICELLLASGADPDCLNILSNEEDEALSSATLLWNAARDGAHRFAELLLRSGADPCARGPRGRTPLLAALERGEDLRVFDMLLSAGADPNASDADGRAPLWEAARRGALAPVRALLAAGADPNAHSHSLLAAPLAASFGAGHFEAAEALLAAGAAPLEAVSQAEAAGALFLCARRNFFRVLDMLLAAGAEPDLRGAEDDNTPLCVAAQAGHYQAVEVLLAAGAGRNAPDREGRTPLWIAAYNGRHDVAELLVAAGADKGAAFQGITPLQIAYLNDHAAIYQVLSSPFPPPPRGLLRAAMANLNRVKLMVVGRAAVGKTTLLRSLFGEAFDPTIPSTDGIDLGEFSFEGIQFMTWDFGGQKVYRFTHQLFLTPHALYLVLFNLCDNPQESLKELRFWLNSISARCPQASFLLVATHADKVKPEEQLDRSNLIREALASEYPQYEDRFQTLFPISPSKGKAALQQAIHHAAKPLNIQAPDNYIRALGRLLNMQPFPPVITLHEAVGHLTPDSLRNASTAPTLALLEAFHHLGFISSFPNPHSKSGGIIVLRPQWIARLLSSIVTTKHRMVNSETGLISHHALTSQLWSDHNEFPPAKHQDLVHLLSELDVVFPVNTNQLAVSTSSIFSPLSSTSTSSTSSTSSSPSPSTSPPPPSTSSSSSSSSSSTSSSPIPNELVLYFIPCMLREEAPDIRFFLPPKILTESPIQLHRRFHLATAVPVAVIPPIMIDLMSHGELRARWQQGCLARLPVEDNQGVIWVQLWRSQANVIELKIWGESTKHTTIWVRRLASMLRVRLTEFYHLKYDIVIPCPNCSRNEGHHFKWLDLQSATLARQIEVSCSPSQLHTFRIDSLAPDLCFHDLSAEGFVVPWEALTEMGVLGQGGYGRVLKMSIPSHHLNKQLNRATSSTHNPEEGLFEVAVKLLITKEMNKNRALEIFQEFQHEVYLMSALNDPNIVPLWGICLPPQLAMIMEVVGGGDLYGQLNDPLGLRSSLFGFIKKIDHEFSTFKTSCSKILDFKNIFMLRHRLMKIDRLRFESRCIEALPEEYQTDRALRWIEQQICGNTRHQTLIVLQNKSLVDYYLLPKEKLAGFELPVMPELTTLGDYAFDKAKQAFIKWVDILSRCDVAAEISEVESFEKRFFDAVHLLTQAYQRDLPFAEFKEIKEQTEHMLDDLCSLSAKHAHIVVPLSPMLRLKLALDVCRGMVHMHSLHPPIVHRDLKTPNVFLTRSLSKLIPTEEVWSEPLAKVGDFGLSLMISTGGSLRFGHNNLNPTWAAPEILQGARYTPAVDVYAMGLLLWELLMREHPFRQLSEHLIAQHVIGGGRPSISEQARANPINHELITLIESCWHQNPLERPNMRMIYGSLVEIAQVHQYHPLLQSLKPLPQPCGNKLPTAYAVAPYDDIQSAPFVSAYSLRHPTQQGAIGQASLSSAISSTCRVCSTLLIPASRVRKLFRRNVKCSVCQSTVCKRCVSKCCSSSLSSSSSPLSSPPSPSSSPLSSSSSSSSPSSSSSSTSTTISSSSPSTPLTSSTKTPSREELRVSFMLAPFEQKELLWFGFENGLVGVLDYQHAQQDTDALFPLLCHAHESHPMRVNTMISFSGYGEYETIWSGSEDGTLSVWAGHPQMLEEIFDAHWMQGSLKNEKGVQVWVECEHGNLSWYAKRYDSKSIQTIQLVSQVRSIQLLLESSTLVIMLDSDKIVRFSAASDDVSIMQEWFRKLKNVSNATRSSVVRLASFYHSNAGIVAFQSMDRVVWSADTQFVLNEWSLTSAADTGLHATLQLTTLRKVQLDVTPLIARLRTICGFVRVNQDTLWIAVGNRWMILNVASLAPAWHEDPLVKMGKLTSVTPVLNGNQREIWCLDDDGRIFVWTFSPQSLEQPEFIGEMLDPSWNHDVDQVRCLQQAHPHQVWMGTSTGKILAWDITSRHLIPSEHQPLSANHPMVYKRGDQFRSVNTIRSIIDSHSPLTWSAGSGAEFQLRRFSFDNQKK